MPNWCENHLVIAGKEKDLDILISKIKEVPSHLSEKEYKSVDGYCLFENFYPTPADLLIGNAPMNPTDEQKANLEKYGYADWYSWRIDNWGTKWQESNLFVAQEKHVSERGGIASIGFNFDTAWGPALDLFNKASGDYPNLIFCLYYEEPGMGFCGRNIWANGQEVERTEGDIISNYFDEEYLYEYYSKEEESE